MDALAPHLESLMDSLSTNHIAILAGFVCVVVGFVSSQIFSRLFLGLGADKTEPDKPFENGLSLVFILKVLIQGPSLDTIVKILGTRVRRRLYVAHKHWLFSGYETWWVGHPAIAAHVFAPANMKKWRKLTKPETLTHFYLPVGAEGDQRTAMLYTGDDDRWRKTRQALTPFFYTSDFTKLDDRMDSIVSKHLKRVAMQNHGEEELLEILLKITVDLLCQCLYQCALPPDELDILTDCMAEYVVPGTSLKGQYPGNLTAMEYHMKVAVDMAEGAPEGTLGYIIKNECPSLTDELRTENLAFFLEALTPAFASFWTICNIGMMTHKEEREKAKSDAVFRQQCIKESLRMYPPVPILWPRKAEVDHEMPNPLYGASPIKRGFFEKLFPSTPIEEQPILKIKKGTVVVLFPGVYHYDDRFWVRPKEFLPERWDKEPDVLQGETAKFETRKRKTQFPGLVGSRQTVMGLASNRVSMLSSNSRKQDKVAKSLRAGIFGVDHELATAEANIDQLFEATSESVDIWQAWSFLPFGLGPHTCMGRRLAIRMVDSIVFNFLEYDVQFYNGILPSMFTRKQWHERTVATAAAYNFPADPVLIQVKKPKKTEVRKSVFTAPISAEA